MSKSLQIMKYIKKVVLSLYENFIQIININNSNVLTATVLPISRKTLVADTHKPSL